MPDNVLENTLEAQCFAERKFCEEKGLSNFLQKLSRMATWHMFCEKKKIREKVRQAER